MSPPMISGDCCHQAPFLRERDAARASPNWSSGAAGRQHRHQALQGGLPRGGHQRRAAPSSLAALAARPSGGMPHAPRLRMGGPPSATSNAAASPWATAAEPPAHRLRRRTQLPAVQTSFDPDPTQRRRIAEIRQSLGDRIAEAEREGWLQRGRGPRSRSRQHPARRLAPARPAFPGDSRRGPRPARTFRDIAGRAALLPQRPARAPEMLMSTPAVEQLPPTPEPYRTAPRCWSKSSAAESCRIAELLAKTLKSRAAVSSPPSMQTT